MISAATTTAAKFTTTTTSDQWAAVMASFKPATTTSAGGGSTASTTIRYVHTDQLTGSNIVTDASGAIAETLDYYPYGATRLDTKSGGYGGEKRKFAGHEYDSGTGLTYMDARYQSGSRGNFISEDPSFLDLGSPNLANDVQQSTLLANPATIGLSAFTSAANGGDPNRRTLALSLADPNSLNSYSYVENNPLKAVDPDGKNPLIFTGAIVGGITLGVPEYFAQYGRTGDIFLDAQGRGMVAGKTITGVAAGALVTVGRPDLAIAVVTAGSLVTGAKFDPTNDPAKLGTRYGQATGEGLTLNIGDSVADRVLNPALTRANPILYAQTQMRVGSIIDAAKDYTRLLRGRSGFGNVNSSMGAQGNARSTPTANIHCYGYCGNAK